MRQAFLYALLAVLAGCTPPSPSQRLADSAYELNGAMRFGRMDVAIDTVTPKGREAYAKKHAGWGQTLRIVDVEFGGLEALENGDAHVFVLVTWQRVDESRTRVTQLVQRWHDERGTWSLLDESRKSGDYGLLGDVAPEPAGSAVAAPGPSNARFRTHVIAAE